MSPSQTLKQRYAPKVNGGGGKSDQQEECTNKISPPKEKKKYAGILRLLDGIGGTVDFSFFRAPTWVNLSLPPGTTSEWEVNQGTPDWKALITGYSTVYSPNLIWLIITALIYVMAPYNIQEFQQQQQSSEFYIDWFLRRALLNSTVMLLYYGFWHTALYGLHWASRPFAQGRVYRWSKTFHNMWYCLLGCWQWTAWEMIMVYLYATGRIGYQADHEILASWKDIANFWACIILVPFFREVHFFFAHRFIHLRCLYKYIHALHHRNTDIEPFSGLCMSPSEHLYYFSSIAPSVYWHASPFQFLWNGIHLLLSPGAAHSGWEDHWHSDQFHAAHHRYFECNYGTPGTPFDRWFGCFRETMAPQTKQYNGVAKECISQEDEADSHTMITARADAKSTLLGLPSWDQMLYMAATGVGLPLFVLYYVSNPTNEGSVWQLSPTMAALLVSIGPLVLAGSLSFATANPPIQSWSKFRYTMLYPFHKEALFGKFGLSLVLGTLLSIVPTFHFFQTLFVNDPRDTAYHWLWTQ